MSITTENVEMALGSKVRELRTQRHMLAKELAEAAGVSPSLISQIENNVTTPSIDVLRRISAVLDVHVGEFFNQNGETGASAELTSARPMLVRAGRRKKLLLPESHWVYELLTPDLQGRLELLWLEIGPGGSAPTEVSRHEGEEANVVIKGRVHIWVGDEEFALEAGDSITFESSRPHRTANLDDETAVLISAITPPSF